MEKIILNNTKIEGNVIFNPPWTPKKMSTLFWYDASDLSTIASTGNEVTQVLDKSGNNYTLTRDGTNPGPNTRTRTLNGLNVFEWVGNNCLDNNSFTYNQVATPLNIAMVIQIDTPINTQAFFLAGTNSASTGQRMSSRVSGTNQFQVLGGNGISDLSMGGGLVTRNQPYLILPKFNSASSAWRVNGSQTNTGNIGTNSFVNIQFGHNEIEGSDLTGYIAEAVAFSDNTQQEIVEGYLAWKWGMQGNLPPTHPYKNFPPKV
jgi:hypothetical protein